MPSWLSVKPFLDAQATADPGAWTFFGAPFDSTSSFRPGSRLGPTALRQASEVLESYCPLADRELAETGFGDAGDLELPMGDSGAALAIIGEGTAEILAAGHRPLLLGGEHLVSLPAIRETAAVHPELCLIHLDAHADLREDYLGVRLSHATVMRRVLETIPVDRFFQLGIRSGTREEWNWMRANRTLCPANPGAARRIAAAIGDRPVYLSIDLDILDPSVLPGTGTPEPGGLCFAALDELLRGWRGLRLVGADVVELNPTCDPSGASAVVAAKLLRTLLLNFS